MFTTSAADEDIASSYQAYANAYVTKPVDLAGLDRAVERIYDFYGELVTRPYRI